MEHTGHYKCAIFNSYFKLLEDTHLKSSAILGWFPDFEASFQASGERREVVFFSVRKHGFEHPMKNLDVLKGTPKKKHIFPIDSLQRLISHRNIKPNHRQRLPVTSLIIINHGK